MVLTWSFYLYGYFIALALSYTIIRYCNFPQVKEIRETIPEDVILLSLIITSLLSWGAVLFSIFDMIYWAYSEITKK